MKQKKQYDDGIYEETVKIMAAEEEVAKYAPAVEACQKAKVDVPPVIAERLVELRANIATSEGVIKSIQPNLDIVETKITGLKNGVISAERANTQKAKGATGNPNKYHVDNRPEGLSRKQWNKLTDSEKDAALSKAA